MNIILDGFFDNNFGDDLMRIIVIKNMPECEFFINSPRETALHLKDFKNVHISDNEPSADAYLNVIGTGFLYNSKTSQICKIQSIIFGKRKKYKKTALIDCSIEPISKGIPDKLTAYDLKWYGHITCRDSVSFDYVKSKCSGINVRKYNDIAFAIDNSYIYKNTGESCLGIMPVIRFGEKENYDYFKKLAACADKYIEKNNKKVLLFALDSAYENDVFAALTIKQLMKNQDMAEIIPYNSKPEYIFQNIARCKKIISSRFHGIIASVLLDVPVIAVSDRQKIALLAKDLGFEVIRKDNLDEHILSSCIERETPPAILKKEYKDDALGHIRDLREYLGLGN